MCDLRTGAARCRVGDVHQAVLCFSQAELSRVPCLLQVSVLCFRVLVEHSVCAAPCVRAAVDWMFRASLERRFLRRLGRLKLVVFRCVLNLDLSFATT